MAPLTVRCNAVSPGFLVGGMGGTTADDLDAIMGSQIPLGLSGTPADIAAVVCFLLSDEARYITGETIDVDGGLYPD